MEKQRRSREEFLAALSSSCEEFLGVAPPAGEPSAPPAAAAESPGVAGTAPAQQPPLPPGLRIDRGEVVVSIDSRSLAPFMARCKSDPALRFDMLLDVTAVDWMDERPERFELVYQLLSLPFQNRLQVSVCVAEAAPEVDSMVQLWSSANFLEREVWDMFGIRFRGHPDLRRILMYEEFTGHPLRKDYPVQGKQPRIALRAPEVENTARRMERPDLVTIRRRSDGAGRAQDLSGQQPGSTGQK